MAKVDYTFQSNAHIQRVARYVQMLERFFDDATDEFCSLFEKAKYDGSSQFFFEDYPTLKKKADKVVNGLSSSIYDVILTGTSAEWKKSNEITDQMVRELFKSRGVDIDKIKNSDVVDLFNNHDKALEAFQKRKIGGLSLSDKVWNMAEYHRLETQLALSIESGDSAAELARKVKKCLKEPDKLFRRVRDKHGELRLSKNAKAYHPGAGVYRSSVRNAQRLARTEINMAYREAEMQRYQDLDFIVGFEVKRSTHPYPCDICESHKGKYPKDFKFNGWHPNCYSKDSEVLTALGWKRFEDVSFSDEIISLNPYTREIENVCITAKQKYWYDGLMYRFFNKNLDCLVTPEHRMVYLNKSDGEIKYCQAHEYRKGKGAFYRSAENSAVDIDSMIVRGCSYDFDAFCEFMGYWLSDGSLEHDSGVSVSQNVGEKARECIVDCIKALGFTPKMREDRVMFYSSRFNAYLKQFGYSFTKFIPDEIKNASVRQIKIFLDAFIKCDGYERQSKSFVGSHGNVFVSENGERLYFTTSPRMAGDLCQCLLKVGHRPSVNVNEPKYSVKKDGSVIVSKKPCYVIRECSSSTATVFDKETIPYNDYVYDLTLERNHIMYIKRNGKCFWGSNCRCYVIPILNTQEEFDRQSDSILRGKRYAKKSVNTVTAPPEGFNKWIFNNKERILRANKLGTLPYYMRDNSTYINKALHSNVIKKSVPPIFDIDVVGPSPIDTTKGILTVGDLKKKVDTHIRWMQDIDKDLALMFKRLDSLDISDREKRELIKDIKKKAAEVTVKYLDDQGYTKGLVYIKEDINHSFGQDMSVLTRGMLRGKYQRDIVVYKDKYGVEFAFPIGAKIEDLPNYDFTEISEFVQSLPKGFREQFKGIYFDDRMHPLDGFFVTIYPDFEGGGMYNGEYITVHHRYKEMRIFSFRFIHEIGHNIDRISSSQKWYDAMRKDKFACSGYALNAAKEDFAEAFSTAYKYYVENPENGLTMFEKKWPNRWEVMKDLFLKLVEM